MEIAYEAGTASELITLVRTDPPDAVILDIRMPPSFSDEGLTAAETIKQHHPDVGVLVLSTYSETAYAVRLLESGKAGVGYLIKDRVGDVSVLVDALERVCAGRSVIDEDIVAALIARQGRTNELSGLTSREIAVLRHMAEGRSNVGIAQALGVATRTVEAYVASLFLKLELSPDEDDNRRVLATVKWMRANIHAE